jgi:hypothetical protein
LTVEKKNILKTGRKEGGKTLKVIKILNKFTFLALTFFSKAKEKN